MTNGGKRENAGRKRGGKNKKTLEKAAIQELFNQRVMKVTDSLFHAQYTLAVGSVNVFRVDEEEAADGKKKRVHTLVTDTDKIAEVLNETDGEGSAAVGDDFYFVSVIPPDNKAIDSLLNRALGKPKDSLDVTSNGETLATFQIATKPLE